MLGFEILLTIFVINVEIQKQKIVILWGDTSARCRVVLSDRGIEEFRVQLFSLSID